MSTVIADFPSENAAIDAVGALKSVSFRNLFDMKDLKTYSGYPCCGISTGGFSVTETTGGARLKLDVERDYLPLVLSVIIDSGGVIQ